MKRVSALILALLLAAAALPARAADSILNDVLRRGTVRIAVNTGNEPRQFADETGNLQGYDIDIANEVAKPIATFTPNPTTQANGMDRIYTFNAADLRRFRNSPSSLLEDISAQPLLTEACAFG